MNDVDKLQAELVLKKINKIKSFKEKVLRIKEEEFKNSVNNIKVIKDNKEKSKNNKDKSERKNHKKNKLKLTLKDETSINENKLEENKNKKSIKNIKDKSSQKTEPTHKENKDKEEKDEKLLTKINFNTIDVSKSVQIKTTQRIQIDSKPLQTSENKTENINEKETKENNNINIVSPIKKEKDNNISEKESVKSISKRKGLSVSLKNINNKIIEEEVNKEEEEEKNNNSQRKNCNSSSPDKGNLKSNKNNNKQKIKISTVKEYKLQYCVYPGNNFKLIDKAMEHRSKNWEKVPTTYSEFCDFVWAPLSHTINFQNCDTKHQYVNHIEFNNEISNKMRLFANLLRRCEEKKIDIFSIFPFTICLQISHWSFNDQLVNFEKLYKNINLYTPKGNKKFNEMFNVNLSKKVGSLQNINIPETFNSGKNLWIIKPVNLNRGRYITVEKNLNDIIKRLEDIQSKKKIINEKKNGNDIKCEYLIIQKYLEKPLLYQGRKFDIRLWVLFISNKDDEIYIFKQGHLKATCTQYNPDSNDLYVHLTNYSVQKHNENFSKIEIGNEIPFKSFQNELDKNNTGINFYKDIYPKIVRIVRITGGAAKGKINILSRKYCFEIFGYDFIIDENYQPYLLEINTNPGLEISSPLIEELLPRMIDDALKLTIDKEYTKSYKYANEESKFPVTDYNNNENMWEKFSII